jgi:hypothetical protein
LIQVAVIRNNGVWICLQWGEDLSDPAATPFPTSFLALSIRLRLEVLIIPRKIMRQSLLVIALFQPVLPRVGTGSCVLPGASIHEAIVNATIDSTVSATVSLAIRAFVKGFLDLFTDAYFRKPSATRGSDLIRIIIALSPAGRSISLQISVPGEYYATGLQFHFVVIGFAPSLEHIEIIPVFGIFDIFVVLGVFPFSLCPPVRFVIGIAICITVICIIVPFVTGIRPLVFVTVTVPVDALRVRTASDQVD